MGLGGNDWEWKNRGKECSSVIDAGFNGGGICSFSRLNGYGGYIRSSHPKAKLLKKWKAFKIRVCGPTGGVSARSTVLPIWITDSFRPAGAMLIDGMAELLLGLDTIRQLDITVVFGSSHFRVGKGDRKWWLIMGNITGRSPWSQLTVHTRNWMIIFGKWGKSK